MCISVILCVHVCMCVCIYMYRWRPAAAVGSASNAPLPFLFFIIIFIFACERRPAESVGSSGAVDTGGYEPDVALELNSGSVKSS